MYFSMPSTACVEDCDHTGDDGLLSIYMQVLVLHGGCGWQDDVTLDMIDEIYRSAALLCPTIAICCLPATDTHTYTHTHHTCLRFHEVVPEDTLFEDLLWVLLLFIFLCPFSYGDHASYYVFLLLLGTHYV